MTYMGSKVDAKYKKEMHIDKYTSIGNNTRQGHISLIKSG